MPRTFENKDKTPAQASEYAYLLTTSLRAVQVTRPEWERIRERAKHPGNVREVRLWTIATRGLFAFWLFIAWFVGASTGMPQWIEVWLN